MSTAMVAIDRDMVRARGYVDGWIKSRRTAQTKAAYAADVRHFVAAFKLGGPDDLLSIQPEEVAAYRDRMVEGGYAPSTVARHLSTLRSLFDYCLARGWIERNPASAKLVHTPHVSTDSPTNGLTADEVRRMLNAIDREGLHGLRDFALLITMLFHGLRRQEVIDLHTESFGEDRGYRTLRIVGKGSKVRVHPVQDRVFDAVRAYLRADGRSIITRGVLFREVKRGGRKSRKDDKLSTVAVYRIVKQRCRAAGITKRLSPHSLRHTSITRALDCGANLRRVSYFAGHSAIQTTVRYDRDRENLDQSAAHTIAF